jgi:hypothetical protein
LLDALFLAVVWQNGCGGNNATTRNTASKTEVLEEITSCRHGFSP